MRNGYKALGAILAVSMMGSLMTGCKSGQKISGGGATGAKVTLTVEVYDRGKPGQPAMDNNYWTKWINSNFGAKNNCTVQFIPVPRSQETDKLNVLMAANQAPDICFTYDPGTVYTYYSQGGLTQLDSLMTKYGSTLSKYLGKDLLKYGTFSNKLYAVPAKRTILLSGGTFIRKDWLDKLGLPLPTNRDEFYQDLVAFRDKNPGNVSGVVPMAYALGSNSNIFMTNLPDSFYKDMGEETLAKYMTTAGGCSWTMPGYKDYMQFMNKLYNEKLISPDFAIDKTGKQAEADLSNGKGGVVCTNWDYVYRSTPGIETNLEKSVPGASLVPVSCFRNDQGKYPTALNSPNGFYIIVPKSSKNAELAVKYLNWMSDTKVTTFLQNGEEGVDYKMVDGIPQPTTPSTLTGDKMMTSVQNVDYDITSNGPELGSDEKNLKATAIGYPGFASQIEESAKINSKDGVAPYYSALPNTANAKYASTLSDKSLEMQAKLITCKPDQFSSLYDSLVKDYMAAGGQAIVDENVKNYKITTGKTLK